MSCSRGGCWRLARPASFVFPGRTPDKPVEPNVPRVACRSARAGRPVLQVECVCTDPDEHRRRVETRSADISGLLLPDWQAVTGRQYEPWPEADLVLDTTRLSPAEAVARVLAAMP